MAFWHVCRTFTGFEVTEEKQRNRGGYYPLPTNSMVALYHVNTRPCWYTFNKISSQFYKLPALEPCLPLQVFYL